MREEVERKKEGSHQWRRVGNWREDGMCHNKRVFSVFYPSTFYPQRPVSASLFVGKLLGEFMPCILCQESPASNCLQRLIH
jgi:hypothetical protein